MIPAPPSKLDAGEALVREASEGSLEAFNQLILRYQNIAYHHAYALLGDASMADDITQDSFIKAFQNMPRFRGGSFRAWLLRIVTNTAYDHFRRSKSRLTQTLFPEDDDGEEIESPAWLADPFASPEAIVERNEVSNRLYQLVEELPDKYRSVLILADLYELDYCEIAEILNVPLGTVKSRLARARQRMRGKILNNFENFGLDFPVVGMLYG